MNNKIFLNLAFSMILITAGSKAAELTQNEKASYVSNHQNPPLADQCALLERDVVYNSEDRVIAIFDGFLKWELDHRLDFCELELLLNSNTPLPVNLKKIAFDALPNAAEEEIRLGLKLIHIKVMRDIIPFVLEEPRCIPKPLSKSRNRLRRNSAVF